MLELINVSKTYFAGKPNQVCALRNVSLTVQNGELISIMGPSGSGKSTLLHIIGLLDKPDSGKYIYNGIDVASVRDTRASDIRNREIGFVMQDYGLISNMNALQNVGVPLMIAGVRGREIRQRSEEALRRVGIPDKANVSAGLLSGGERQRVAIARGMVSNAGLILADEPTGAVDSKTSHEIVELFLELNRLGKTVIIVTHNSLVAQMCSRRLQIIDGALHE